MTIAEQVAIGAASATFLSALFVATQAYFTRRLVDATIKAYLDGHVLLSVVPYGGTGSVNIRLQNVGAGYVEDVSLSFPHGLMGLSEDGPVDLCEVGTIPLHIGSMGPREKREWHIGFTGHPKWRDIPKIVPYKLAYFTRRLPKTWYRREGKRHMVEHEGTLDLDTYTGSLVRAYTDLEDLRAELERLRKEVKKISDPVTGGSR